MSLILINKHLVKIIIEIAIFLEFANDDMINNDYVVQIMESIAYELQLMKKQQKKDFIKIVKELSNNYEKEKKEFVKQLCENWGLID